MPRVKNRKINIKTIFKLKTINSINAISHFLLTTLFGIGFPNPKFLFHTIIHIICAHTSSFYTSINRSI